MHTIISIEWQSSEEMIRMMRVMLLLVCSVVVSACASTPRSYEFASWESMDYYDASTPSASGTEGP
jgi:hypothetical protein